MCCGRGVMAIVEVGRFPPLARWGTATCCAVLRRARFPQPRRRLTSTSPASGASHFAYWGYPLASSEELAASAAALPAGWVQHDDGSWWALDDYGCLHRMAFGPVDDDLDAAVQSALGAIGDPIDVAPLSVADTEVPQ